MIKKLKKKKLIKLLNSDSRGNNNGSTNRGITIELKTTKFLKFSVAFSGMAGRPWCHSLPAAQGPDAGALPPTRSTLPTIIPTYCV
jgi:hypothetical protein